MTRRLRLLAARSRKATTEAAVAERYWARLRALENDPDLRARLDRWKDNT